MKVGFWISDLGFTRLSRGGCGCYAVGAQILHPTILHPTSERSGISMLEVLISIMVVAIGLVSIAALIPVGGIQVQKSNTQERTATLGLNAFREFQVRGMDDFSKAASPWLRENGSNYLPLADLTYLPPIAIDPMMMARIVNDDSTGAINSGTNSASQQLQYFPICQSGTPPVVMHRLTVPGLFSFGNPNSNRSATFAKTLAEAVFAAQDDVVSQLPDDTSQAGSGQVVVDRFE